MSSVHHKPFRLPPVKTLRVHAPNGTRERPCVQIMSSVLACWASAGYSTSACAQVEQALRACMDQPTPSKPRTSEVNYHLSRFQDRVSQPKSKAPKKK